MELPPEIQWEILSNLPIRQLPALLQDPNLFDPMVVEELIRYRLPAYLVTVSGRIKITEVQQTRSADEPAHIRTRIIDENYGIVLFGIPSSPIDCNWIRSRITDREVSNINVVTIQCLDLSILSIHTIESLMDDKVTAILKYQKPIYDPREGSWTIFPDEVTIGSITIPLQQPPGTHLIQQGVPTQLTVPVILETGIESRLQFGNDIMIIGFDDSIKVASFLCLFEDLSTEYIIIWYLPGENIKLFNWTRSCMSYTRKELYKIAVDLGAYPGGSTRGMDKNKICYVILNLMMRSALRALGC